MGLLDKQCNGTLTGPRPENGLGKLNKIGSANSAMANPSAPGLSSKVRVVEGKFDEHLGTIKQFLKEMAAPFFEFVFLDHWKNRYMPDYLLLKERGLIRKGSGIFADSMGPLIGPADFRKYVKTHPEELETQEFKSNAGWIPDSVTVSSYKLE